MKKIIFLGLLIMTFNINVNSQQLENPGFENWEDAGTVLDEPVDWSSIKTSDGGDIINNAAPVVWERSDDAHSGLYSLKLYNVSIFNIIATGTMTNGRVHADFNPDLGYIFTDPGDPQWNTPFTGRPDSLVIWLKFFPQDNDSAQVQVVLHTGDGTIPPTPDNQGNWVANAKISAGGTIENWTRFSVPFTYYNNDEPEYALVILNSGNGTIAVEGSYALFDDIKLVYGPNSIATNLQDEYNIHYSNGKLFLNEIYSKVKKGSDMNLIDLTGRVVLSIPVVSSHISIPESQLTRGIYLVQLDCNDQFYYKKIFIN